MGNSELGSGTKPYTESNESKVDKRDDPYAPQQSGGCCIVM